MALNNPNNFFITLLMLTVFLVQPEPASGVDTSPCGIKNSVPSESFEKFVIDLQWGPNEPATTPSAMDVGFASSMGSLAQLTWSIYGVCKAPENLIYLLESANSFEVLERYDRNNESHDAQKRAGGTRREYVYGIGGEQYYHRYLVPPHLLSAQEAEALISQVRDHSPYFHVKSPMVMGSGIFMSGGKQIIRVSGPNGDLDIKLHPHFRRIDFRQGPKLLASGYIYPEAVDFWKNLVESKLAKD